MTIGTLLICAATMLGAEKTPVDWVNPEMGSMSHLLVPCFETVQRPNAMMRFVPPTVAPTMNRIDNFYLCVFGHREIGNGCIKLWPFCGAADQMGNDWSTEWEQMHVTPYRYDVYLDDYATRVDYAPGEQSAVFAFTFEKPGTRALLFETSITEGTSLGFANGALSGNDRFVNVKLSCNTYLWAEFDTPVVNTGRFGNKIALVFPDNARIVKMRYAVSLVSLEQAQANLKREVPDFDLEKLAEGGRARWNEKLGKIEVEGGTDNDKTVFYTSLWRCYERMVNVAEGDAAPFFTDDWIWDTYLAQHPLMALLEPSKEGERLASSVRAAHESPEGWMATFPSVAGDTHHMNGQHFIAPILDGWRKGVRGFDLKAAYEACKKTVEESTKTPWVRAPKNELDFFYDEHGYIPALHEGEKETVAAVHPFEKRQAVAITLAASYDAWCLSELAKEVGDTAGAEKYAREAQNYRHLWKPETQFFHPKDKDGKWIEPFDYRFSGGMGCRDYYDENNGWTYRWQVMHDVPGLIALFGGNEAFVSQLDRLFSEPLGCARYEWVYREPDSSGMVGQFTMGNEPSFHIPYLYALAGAPHKTERRVRQLLNSWFRNDKMGIPGDEDGGGMSAFVVFSMLGFYPVTPGLPEYVLGSPVFTRATIHLENGKTLVISAPNASADAKYVKRVTLGGQPVTGVKIPHARLAAAQPLTFEMSTRAE